MLIGPVAERNPTRPSGFPGADFSAEPGQTGHGAGSEPDRDARLVLRVQGGDLGAFEELVDRYKQRLVNYAARSIGDPIEAQDVAQKTFLQVFRSILTFRFTARFSSWLFAIARNQCLNELRRRARHPAEPLENHGSEHERPLAAAWVQEPNVCARVLELELLGKLEQALAALPERQRTALLLLREEDVSYEEIAAILGTTLPATKSLIHHGRQRLKAMLGRYLGRNAEPGRRKVDDRRRRTENGRRRTGQGSTEHGPLEMVVIEGRATALW